MLNRFYNSRLLLPVVMTLVCFALGTCAILGQGNIAANTKSGPTTTTIQPELLVCMWVPHADDAQLVADDGYVLSYSGDGTWAINDVVIGHADAEDSSFEACGTADIMDHLDVVAISTACAITRDGNQYCNKEGDTESPVQVIDPAGCYDEPSEVEGGHEIIGYSTEHPHTIDGTPVPCPYEWTQGPNAIPSK